MNKKHLKISILSFLLLFLVICVLLFNQKIIKHPFKNNIESSVKVQIKNGDSVYSVIDQLDKAGELNNGKLTKLYIKVKKIKTNNIKVATYDISSDSSIESFIQEIITGKGKKDTIIVTIPEGYHIEEIGNVLEEKGIIDKSKFLSACKEYKLPIYIESNSKRKYALEGYLFPDTYEFNKGVSGNEIIDIMLNRFEFVLNDIQGKFGKIVSNEDTDDLIIMASIVEKEISSKDEREKAASVFYNRLNIKMKLQSCATVLYALGYHKDKLYDKDLKVKSPYNTYIVSGLPVGPICCPGRAAIEAALNPEKTKLLYFVSKNDGTHVFAEKYKDFSDAKKKYQGGN